MEIAVIKTTTEYSELTQIAEMLGWNVTVSKNYGSPYHPIVAVTTSRVYFVSGKNARQKIEQYAGQGAHFVSALQFIKYLIKNSPLRS